MWHWVDLTILAVIGLSVLTGLIRGFVKELVALSVWILAFWLAFHYSQHFDPWLEQYIQDQTARTATAFILILIGTLIAGGIVNALLGFILKRSGLSGTDRILGMGFGFIRGLFIVTLLMFVVQMTSLPHETYAKESKLYTHFDPFVSWLSASLPDLAKQVKFLENESKKKSISKVVESTSLNKLGSDYEFSDA